MSQIPYNVQIILQLENERRDTNDDPVCSSVVAARYSPKSLLASSIPNLKLNRLPILLHSPNFKINSNGANVTINVRIISKSEKETRFADRGVSD